MMRRFVREPLFCPLKLPKLGPARVDAYPRQLIADLRLVVAGCG
jgi:hypothetical protein